MEKSFLKINLLMKIGKKEKKNKMREDKLLF